MNRYILHFLIVNLIAFASCSIKEEPKESSPPDLTKTELHSGWQFIQEGKEDWLDASVPGNVHMDLLDNLLIEDPFYKTNERDLQWIEKENWTYKTSFRLNDDLLKKKKHHLVFEGLDTYAKVYLNDSLILDAYNMFHSHRVDVSSLLRNSNVMVIKFESPINKVMDRYDSTGFKYPANNDQAEKKVSIFTRKAGYHFGWDWGPRFVTFGIWRPVYIESFSSARIDDLHLVQTDLTDNKADLLANVGIDAASEQTVTLETILVNPGDSVENVLKTTDHKLSAGLNKIRLDVTIDEPERWWPVQLGEQPLYTVKVNLKSGNRILASSSRRIGLRTVEVVHEFDKDGKSFFFKVNDIPVFMKGANYIPSDNFQSRIDEEKYDMLIQAALDGNMNMLRVWGGGIYEEDYFYDRCDEEGLLLWQDFMFGCSMYPGDEAFLNNVRKEASDNIIRLRNHPSVVIWCGNNEMETAWHGWGWQEKHGWSQKHQDIIWGDYKKLFHEVLPEVVAEHDPSRFYHRSSPSAGSDTIKPQTIGYGDKHFWGVWHAEMPYEAYSGNISRFMSEYGFQSFPLLETVKTYATEKDFDIESEVMLHHQRHPRGNQLVREYMQRDYVMPKDFENFLYVGQVLQAEIIKYAAEAHRRAMPYCMGSLYWQLDDCWPVASWAGMDYYGNWKAQHFFAKKFYAKTLLSFEVKDDSLYAYVVNDDPNPVTVNLKIELLNFSGDQLNSFEEPVKIKANSSDIYFKTSVKDFLSGMRKEDVAIHGEISIEGKPLSSNVKYLDKPKNLNLPKAKVEILEIKGAVNEQTELVLKSETLAKNVYIKIKDGEGKLSDNFFDMMSGRTYRVFVKNRSKNLTAEDIELKTITDTY